MGNIHYHSRKLVRKYSLCTPLWNIYYQEYTHFTENGRIEGKNQTQSLIRI